MPFCRLTSKEAMSSGDEWRFEIPYGVTSLQTRQVVLKYADNHPEKTHFEFGAFVVLSFHDAWPCKK